LLSARLALAVRAGVGGQARSLPGVGFPNCSTASYLVDGIKVDASDAGCEGISETVPTYGSFCVA
jgi:hypothetical protein